MRKNASFFYGHSVGNYLRTCSRTYDVFFTSLAVGVPVFIERDAPPISRTTNPQGDGVIIVMAYPFIVT